MRRIALLAVVLLQCKATSQDSPLSFKVRRITLEQVKQSVDPPVSNPLMRLGQFSIEAAKHHCLGVQADYHPKFGAVFANLRYTRFLGRSVTIRGPLGR